MSSPPDNLDACIHLAVQSLTRAHASPDEVAATIRQIVADHQEQPWQS